MELFEKPILTIESGIDEQLEVLNTSNAETTSAYDEVWTTWLASNV